MRRLVGGRYRLDGPVGAGGMAVVWRGHDLVLRRTVAVKMVSPRSAADRRMRGRLRSEAYAAAQLDHANVARVYDYGEVRDRRFRKLPYLVMEFVDGETLAQRLCEHGRLEWREAVTAGAGVAAALAAAHARGLVHRDVKPGNVMVSGPDVKVVDFGIAAAVGQNAEDTAGVVLATPAYLAPELRQGGSVTPACDMYAFGVLLYECLTGAKPWMGTLPPGALTRPLPPPPEAAGLPEAAADLCGRCLALVPEDRPTSAEAALVLRDLAGMPPLAPPPAAPVTAVDIAREPVVTDRHRPGRALRLVAAVTVGLAAASAGGLAFSANRDGGSGQAGDGNPQHAPAGPPTSGAGSSSAAGCVAKYTVRPHPDGTFSAVLAITNGGRRALSRWAVRFALPPGQDLLRAAGLAWVQRERTVVLTSPGQLGPGETARVELHGTAGDDPRTTPTGFALAGAACGRTVVVVTADASPAATPDAHPAPTRPHRTRRATPRPAPTASPSVARSSPPRGSATPTASPSTSSPVTRSPSARPRPSPSPNPQPSPTRSTRGDVAA